MKFLETPALSHLSSVWRVTQT